MTKKHGHIREYPSPHYEDLVKYYDEFYEWIDKNRNQLIQYDQIPPLFFDTPNTTLLDFCESSSSYSNFAKALCMDDTISERGTKSIKFLDTSIKLEINYFMYQLVHRILERRYPKQDILQNFLNFFYGDIYEIEFKYRIRNFSFPSLEFFADNHMDIIFENADQTFIKIRLREKIWDNSKSNISKLGSSNIIDILSTFFEMVTSTRMIFETASITSPTLIVLKPESNAVEGAYNIYDIEKLTKLDFSKIEKLKNYWKILVEGYDEYQHSMRLLIDSDRMFNSTEDRFLYLIYCLESLIGVGDRESLSFKITYRTANLVEKDPVKRIRIREQMRRFYSDRSKFVHEGRNEITSDKMEILRKYVHVVFRTTILINKYIDDFPLDFSLKEFHKNITSNDIKKKHLEGIIDFLKPLNHKEIRGLNKTFPITLP